MFAIATLILIASVIGTITGFGTSTIMMPILIMYYPAPETLLFVTIIHWFNALNRSLIFRQGLSLKLILGFGLTGIVTAYLGAKTFSLLDPQLITKVISIFLFFYSIFLYFNPKFEVAYTHLRAGVFGAVSGFIAGIFGMGGAIRAAFLAAFNLPKEVYLANSALILLLIDSSRLTTYFCEKMHFYSILDLETTEAWIWLFGFLVVSLLGVQLGKMIVDKVPQEKFRHAVAVFLALVALKLFFV